MARPLDELEQDGYPEMLLQLAYHVEQKLVERGIDATHAGEIGFETAEFIRFNFGKTVNYIPIGRIFEVTQKHKEIFDDFTRLAGDAEAVARKHDITVQHAYRVYKAVRDREIRKRQGDMFGG